MTTAFLLFFALFWSGITLGFDGYMAYNSWQQFQTLHYPCVEGKVTASEIKSHRGSKGGTTYSAEINYVYTVGTQKFFAQRLRYIQFSSSSYSDAFGMVSEHPAGSAVTVYYDPAQPQEAVLYPGIDGVDFIPALFLTPFNMMMFGLWCGCAAWLRERWFRPAAGGVKLIADGRVTRVRLPRWSPIWAGLATTGGLGFLAIFVVGIPTRMHPSIPVVLTAIAFVYGAGLAVYLWQRSKINSGIDDLIINECSRTLELPLTFGRTVPLLVIFGDIQSVWIEKIVHRSSKGGISYTYAPTLRLAAASPQKLADWSDQLKARDFAQWLGKQIGVPVEDESSPLPGCV